MKYFDIDKLNAALRLVNERLKLNNAPKVELVVCGGSALIATRLVPRTTQDVDVVAMMKSDMSLADPEPFPEYLKEAAAITGKTLQLPNDWLNCGPADLFRMGLPHGFKERLTQVIIGDRLTVYYASRIDQIFFKLYAAVDRGGYHITDLLALTPTDDELFQAAKWSMTHDVSEGFKSMLIKLLNELGYEDVAGKI